MLSYGGDMISIVDVAALLSALLLGLSAGLFFAFSVSVMPGLQQVDDTAFVGAMNAINRAILNPLFGIVFGGALLVPAVAAVLAFVSGETARGRVIAASGVVYLLGVLVVTDAVSVPLNEALASNADRRAFEPRWVRFNTLRTVSALLAFVIGLVALVV